MSGINTSEQTPPAKCIVFAVYYIGRKGGQVNRYTCVKEALLEAEFLDPKVLDGNEEKFIMLSKLNYLSRRMSL